MSRSRLAARNVLVTLATQLVSWALTFAVTLYLPRYVGDVGLGKLTFAAAFVGIFGVFVPLGTSTVLVKEIARDRARTGELLLAALLLRLPLGLAMTALAIGVVSALGYSGLVRTLVIVASLGVVVGTLNDALSCALQGQENMTRQSLAVLVEKFLSSGLIIALVMARAPLWALAAVSIFTGAVSLLVNMTAFRALLPTLRWPSRATVRFVAVAGLPFMGWAVFRSLYSQIDPVILGLVADDATVGWYAAASRLVGTCLFLPAALTSALLPTLARLYGDDEAKFRHLARRMLGLVMLCGVPVALLLALLPDRLILLMHYPRSFEHSVPVLRVGGVNVLFYYAAMVLGTTVIACDRQGKMVSVSIAATVLSVPACLLGALLTKHLCGNGAIGAMTSDAAVEALLIIAYARMLPAQTLRAESLAFVGRCFAAALPMAAVFALGALHNAGVWIVLPCVTVYALMCRLLRCVSAEDIRLLRDTLSRRNGKTVTV